MSKVSYRSSLFVLGVIIGVSLLLIFHQYRILIVSTRASAGHWILTEDLSQRDSFKTLDPVIRDRLMLIKAGAEFEMIETYRRLGGKIAFDHVVESMSGSSQSKLRTLEERILSHES